MSRLGSAPTAAGTYGGLTNRVLRAYAGHAEVFAKLKRGGEQNRAGRAHAGETMTERSRRRSCRLARKVTLGFNCRTYSARERLTPGGACGTKITWCRCGRMRPLLTSLMILMFLAPLRAQEASNPGGWQPYRNERFGLSLSYPGEVFEVERTSEAGDGVVFAAHGSDARMLVGALPNSDHQKTIASYQEFVARKSYADYQIHYRPQGSTWFVLSGEGERQDFLRESCVQLRQPAHQ